MASFYLYFLQYSIISKIYISLALAIAMIIIPFIRPLIDHTYIRKTYIFCFKETAGEQYKAKLKKKYRDMEPCPILEEVTIDDIIKELN